MELVQQVEQLRREIERLSARENVWHAYSATMSGAGGTAGSYAESDATARYCLIGKVCYVAVTKKITNVGSWSGQVLTAMPIAAVNSTNEGLGGEIIAHGSLTRKAILCWANGSSWNWHKLFGTGITWADMAANDWVHIRAFYEVA